MRVNRTECKPAGRKRLGRFTIPVTLLGEDMRDWLPLFAQCVILKADYAFSEQGMEYLALSPLFDEIDCPDGSYGFDRRVPKYEWDMESYEGRVYSARARRVS